MPATAHASSVRHDRSISATGFAGCGRLIGVSAHRQQAHLDAPLEIVWGLVGSPRRYPEWWPRVIEVRGERFEEGDEYAQVTKANRRAEETNFLVERREDLRGIRMSCQKTGSYADWTLTEARGGTFVNVEMGMLPRELGYRLFDVAAGKRFFRRWSEESLRALGEAAQRDRDGAAQE
jgi:polyketide cyclase/dehydrase/lipid transport protein